MGSRAPFPKDPDEFESDARIAYAKDKETYILEDEEGQEWEWRKEVARWTKAWTQDEIAQHAQNYGAPDENELVEARTEIKASRKRKKAALRDQNTSKVAKLETQKPNKAIYITNLPSYTTMDQLVSVFKRFGYIAESVDNDEKRVKMYHDDAGVFKGEALIIFNRPESVRNACTIADGTELDPSKPNPSGPMRVTVADQNFKKQSTEDKDKDNAAPTTSRGASSGAEKQKAKNKAQEMQRLLADWSSDEDEADAPSTLRGGKTVIVVNAFRLFELQTDPELREELEEDMKEEASKHGKVDAFRLFDKEPEGVLAIRFTKAVDAEKFAEQVDGRVFDDRKLRAHVAMKEERYKMSSTRDDVKYEEVSADLDSD